MSGEIHALRPVTIESGPQASEALREHIAAGLRLFIGLGRAYSARVVSDATEIPLDTLKDYMKARSAPGTPHLLRLMSVLPIGFADHVLQLAGIQASAREGREQDDHGMAADMSQATSLLCDALRDGHIDHVERAAMLPRLRELASKIVGFLERRPR